MTFDWIRELFSDAVIGHELDVGSPLPQRTKERREPSN